MACVYPDSGFRVNDEDLSELREFEDAHAESCWGKLHDFSGALFTYTFIPTGVGTAVTIECECGEKLTLFSDFDPF